MRIARIAGSLSVFLFLWLFLWLFFCLFLGPTVRATSFIERPFPDRVYSAPVIVHGVIGKTWADWANSEDGTRRIYTFYEFDVKETIKGGELPRLITLRELGGEKDGVGMRVEGSAEFVADEDVILFLNHINKDGTFDIWGMMMGKFTLQKGEQGAQGNEYITGMGAEVAAGQRKWTLDSLRKLVKSQAPDVTSSALQSPASQVTAGQSPVSQSTVGQFTAAPGENPLVNPRSEQPSNVEVAQAKELSFWGQFLKNSWYLFGVIGGLGLLIFLWFYRGRKS